HLLDWKLIHRTEDDMNRLFQASKFGRPCDEIRFEAECVNLLAIGSRRGASEPSYDDGRRRPRLRWSWLWTRPARLSSSAELRPRRACSRRRVSSRTASEAARIQRAAVARCTPSSTPMRSML